jgi:hypothetical protein
VLLLGRVYCMLIGHAKAINVLGRRRSEITNSHGSYLPARAKTADTQCQVLDLTTLVLFCLWYCTYATARARLSLAIPKLDEK